MKIDSNDNKYIYYIVGKNLRRIRKEQNLTQAQLANLIGYEEGTIANLENESYATCSLEFLYVISKHLHFDICEFFKDINTNSSK